MGKDTKDITISSIVIQRGGLDENNWKGEQEKDEDLKFVKQWLNGGNPQSKDNLKMRSTTVQRLAKLFDSLIVEPQYGALVIKTAEFEHPEMDPIRMIIPDHLEK